MTIKEIYSRAKSNGQKDICKWMRDVKKAGFLMRPYNGRNCYRGPAVVLDRLWEMHLVTKVKWQWDTLGLQVIIYPVESLRGVESV